MIPGLVPVSAAAVILGVGAPAAARDIFVGSEAPTIQAAIDAAQEGDVVRVPAGTYHEAIRWSRKRITLLGSGGVALQTILEPPSTEEHVIELRDLPEGARLEKLTIRAGSSAGSVWISGGAPTLHEVEFLENMRAVAVEHAEATLSRCEFGSRRLSSVSDGAAIYAGPESKVRMIGCNVSSAVSRGGPAVTIVSSKLEASGCTFGENPGGIDVRGGEAQIRDSVFRDTSDRRHALSAEKSKISLSGCTFDGNIGGHQATIGAVRARDSDVTVTSSIFTKNAHALVLYDCRVTIEGSTFRDSASIAVQILGGKASIQRSTFAENQGGGSFGGAVAVEGKAEADIGASVFRGNTAEDAGALYVGAGATVRVVNTLFFDNRAERMGGAILLGGGTLRVIHTTFARNQANVAGALGVESGGRFDVVNSILWGDTGGEIGGLGFGRHPRGSIDHSIVQGGAGYGNNYDVDPLFADADHGDLHLRLGSPCLGAGAKVAGVPATDLDGNPRPAGAAPDLGCYLVPR
ncbi:MAG: right-handed parallel beta-helix repeat-containing protein [Minicystis sp.]